MKFKTLIFCIINILCAVNYSLGQVENESKVIYSSQPKYVNEKFITLEKHYSIDISSVQEYYINMVARMDIDTSENLYVLDNIENKVFVFDNTGKFIKEMGGKGQGPRELERAGSLYIYNNKIYICESRKGLKIWNTNGDYVDYIIINRDKHNALYRPFDDFFIGSHYTLTAKSVNELKNTKLNIEIVKYSNDLKPENIITKMVVDPKRNFWYQPTGFIAVNTKNEVFFPEHPDKYIINKFDIKGNKIMSFGRDYKRQRYSKEIKNWFDDLFRNDVKLGRMHGYAKYTPVIRHIVIDDRDYVWVVVGECFRKRSGKFSGRNSGIISGNNTRKFSHKIPVISGFSFVC